MDWSSISSGAGSLVGGLFSMFGANQSSKRALQAQRETNAQNYQIWQEQQQHNIDMFNMENQANIDMWNMQNEYNSASAQRQRLEDAGLNPYLMMSGGNAGVASSITSAHANPAQAPSMQQPSDLAFQSPFTAFSNGALNGLVQVAQAFNIGADTNLKNSQSDRIDTLLPFEVKDLKEAYGLKKAQAYQAYQSGDYYRKQAQLESLTQDFKVEYSRELTEFLRAQKVGQMLGNFQQQELNSWLPEEKKIAFLSSVGTLFQQGAQYRLTEAQIRTEIERRLDIAVGRQIKSEELGVYKKLKQELVNSLSSSYRLETIINEGGINYFEGRTNLEGDYPDGYHQDKNYRYEGRPRWLNTPQQHLWWQTQGTRPTTTTYGVNFGFGKYNVGFNNSRTH